MPQGQILLFRTPGTFTFTPKLCAWLNGLVDTLTRLGYRSAAMDIEFVRLRSGGDGGDGGDGGGSGDDDEAYELIEINSRYSYMGNYIHYSHVHASPRFRPFSMAAPPPPLTTHGPNPLCRVAPSPPVPVVVVVVVVTGGRGEAFFGFFCVFSTGGRSVPQLHTEVHSHLATSHPQRPTEITSRRDHVSPRSRLAEITSRREPELSHALRVWWCVCVCARARVHVAAVAAAVAADVAAAGHEVRNLLNRTRLALGAPVFSMPARDRTLIRTLPAPRCSNPY